MAGIEFTRKTIDRLIDLYYMDNDKESATYGEIFDYLSPIVEEVVVKHLDELDSKKQINYSIRSEQNMQDGYVLIELKNIKHDKDDDSKVISVDYEVVNHFGKYFLSEQAISFVKENGFEDEILMIVKVVDGNVVNCESMVFNCGDGKWYLDCCENDFRVYASVAFGRDLMW